MENTEKPEQMDLELELEPLEAEKKDDDIVVEAAPEPEMQVKQPELTVEDGINELKARLEEEKRAREDAEKRYREAQEQANSAKNDAYDTNLRLIDNAIETVKRNSEILKQNLKDAIAAGDADEQANIMIDIQKANLDLDKLIQGKTQYEAMGKQPVQVADPVERIASQLTPRSAEWVRAHPEYARDPIMTRRMVRAHEDAVDEGYWPTQTNILSLLRTNSKSANQNSVNKRSRFCPKHLHLRNAAPHRPRHPFLGKRRQIAATNPMWFGLRQPNANTQRLSA